MKLVKGMSAAAAALTLTLLAVGSALAQVSSEPAQYFGHLRKDVSAANSFWDNSGPTTNAAGDVYANVTTPLLSGISSTALNSQWGDRLATTGMGTLLENDFTVFNSSTSAGPLLTASWNVGLYDATTSLLLGAYTTGVVNFGSGLPAGSFTTITITGLSALSINVNTTDVLMIQQVATHTGAANRLGVALYDPPTVGSSPAYMYINSSTVGPAGYYTLNGLASADPGLRVNVDQVVPSQPSSWGKVKNLYH